MSSPIAKTEKSNVDRALIALHRRLSHGHRIEILAAQFVLRIERIGVDGETRPLRLLDVGCGDMTLADAVLDKLPGTQLQCVDIHACPPDLAERDPRWSRYVQFDGVNLPFRDAEFDAAMLSDVLHHVPIAQRAPLLASVARVSRNVLVKDHFEYGWWSRQSLRLMDFVGNFGYGVSVPKSYIDSQGFARLCAEAGLDIQRLDTGLQLYGRLPVVRTVLSPRWQFFATCTAA